MIFKSFHSKIFKRNIALTKTNNMKIVKIILDDGTSREIEDVKPLSHFKEEHPDSNERYWEKCYEWQFDDFENEIIGILAESSIEEYATANLNLIAEDDVEEKEIAEFSDAEILKEMRNRKLNEGSDIITSSFIERFGNIVKAENSILLDNFLSELESKLNIQL